MTRFKSPASLFEFHGRLNMVKYNTYNTLHKRNSNGVCSSRIVIRARRITHRETDILHVIGPQKNDMNKRVKAQKEDTSRFTLFEKVSTREIPNPLLPNASYIKQETGCFLPKWLFLREGSRDHVICRDRIIA
jgi:hypothetical protein